MPADYIALIVVGIAGISIGLWALRAAKVRRKRLDDHHGTSHITPAGGNVFLDLGFGKEEAERLLAETDREIAEKRENAKNLPEIEKRETRHRKLDHLMAQCDKTAPTSTEVILSESTIDLTRRESIRLMELIENPPPMNEKLKKLIESNDP